MSKSNTISNLQAIKYHRVFSRQQQIYERYAAKQFYKTLKSQIKQFIDIARTYPSGMEQQATNEISSKELAGIYKKVAIRVGNGFARITQAEITAEETGEKSLFGHYHRDAAMMQAHDWIWNPYESKDVQSDFKDLINAYLRLYGADKINGITDTTRKWIIEQIIRGQRNNLSFDRVASMMLNSEITANRAMMIARTETVKFMNLGRFLAAEKSNFEKDKVWVSAHDARVRPGKRPGPFDHHDAHIQRTNLYNPFIVSGEKLMFPGDTSLGASAGNVIRCRCSFALQSVRDENGRLKVKPKMIVGENNLYGFPIEAEGVQFVRHLEDQVLIQQVLGMTFEQLFENT